MVPRPALAGRPRLGEWDRNAFGEDAANRVAYDDVSALNRARYRFSAFAALHGVR
jgi:hypothetical protein